MQYEKETTQEEVKKDLEEEGRIIGVWLLIAWSEGKKGRSVLNVEREKNTDRV